MTPEQAPKNNKPPQQAATIRELLADVVASFRARPTDPPAGSNRPLARGMARLLIVGVTPLMMIMVVGGLLDPGVSALSTTISAAWLGFVSAAALLWHRLSENWLRIAMLLALFFLQLRWTVGWLLFDGPDVFAAILVGLIFTPLLLFTVALMEGRRNGVIIGLLVAANMGLAVIFGSQRESLEAMYMADPRLGFPTFVVMLMYAVFVSLWSSQQEQIRDAELRVSLLAEQANCDVATGLLNRRGLELVARGWVSRDRDFSVVLIQQDQYLGLAASVSPAKAGDGLRALAGAIEQAAGDQITLARWSESAFVLLSPQSDRNLTERMAQQLRRAIASEGGADTPDLGTVSIGYTVTANSEPFASTVGRAEEALATALKVGNCVRAQLAPA